MELKEGNIFLTDTGAGFYEGSTDITRAYALGEIPENMKEDFTVVAMCNLEFWRENHCGKETKIIITEQVMV